VAKEEQIKSQIVLDGEKEYKAACSGINSSLREIGSEMKLTTAEFSRNATSAEALTAKQKVLEKQLEAQKAKAQAAEEGLRRLREAGIDPSNEAYQKFQTRLNEANTEIVKTEQQIDQTSDALKGNKKSAEDAESGWSKLGSTLGTVGKAFGAALAALGTAAVGAATALAGMTVSAAAYADDIMTTATNTRIATDDLQKYTYALNFIDGDIETLTKTMKKNIQTMDKARDGNKQATAAYDKLGISVTDANGELRDSETVYWETIDALGKVANETERDALAMELLGKSGTELNTIIEAGSEAFKALGDEAEAMGVVMSEDALNALGAFDDKVQMLKAGLGGLKNSAGLIALPFLDDLAAKGIPILADFSKGIQDANGDISKMGSVIGEGISGVVGLLVEKLPEFVDMGVEMVKSLIEGIVSNAPTIAEAAVQIIETLVNGIAEMIPLLIDGAAQLIIGLAEGLAKSLPQLIPKVVEMITTIVQTLVKNIPLLISAALQLVQGLADGILQAIPVLINAIPQIIKSLVDALLIAIPQIIDAGIQLLTSIIGALPEIIATISAAIPQIVNDLVRLLTEAIPQLIQAGIDLLTALVEALPEIIQAIVAAIPQIVDSVITAIIESIPLLIQAGIDLLVALIQALPEIITTIVQAIPQIIGGIVDALVGNIDKIIMAGVQLFIALIENLPTIIIEIVKAVPQIIAGIVEAFGSLMGKIVEIGGNLLKGIWEGISGAAGWLWDQISGFFSGVVDGIKNFFGIHSPSTVFAEIGGNMAEGVGVGFGDEMPGVEGDMTSAMSGAGEITAAEAVRAVNDGIIANVAGLAPAVAAIVQEVITGLTAQGQKFNQAGQDFDKSFAAGMVQAIPQITGKIPQIVQSIVTAFTAQAQKFVIVGVDIMKSIAQGMVSATSEVTNKAKEIAQSAVTAVRDFIKDFTTAGEDMVRGIWQGFQNMRSWLENNVRSMMQSIVSAVQSEMQIASPSRVFAGIGEFMARGLGVGFAREMRDVEKTIRRETAAIVPDAPSRDSGNRKAGAPPVTVQQYIYANETSYAKQQREAAKQFRQIAREVMA
jgi:phage-related protein